jgi:gluconate 2-dehydrogenase gamma chain
MNRREVLARMALVTGGSLASSFAQAALRGTPLHVPPPRSAFTDEQRRMIEQLAELIIPRTETPGAIEAGVPVFIDQIVSSWYTAVERGIFLEGLASLDSFCQHNWSERFVTAAPERQTQALQHADQSARAYEQNPARPIRAAPDEHSPFFYKLKLLTVLGYYTSEVGATQELSYNPVPGRYDGDVDFDKVGRQWSY